MEKSLPLQVYLNIALRPEPSVTTQTTATIAGLLRFWVDAGKQPQREWEKWIDLFEVALLAKDNISIPETTKITGTKDKTLMVDMDEIPATKIAISVLYLALRTAALKTIVDKFSTTNIGRVGLTDLLKTMERLL